MSVKFSEELNCVGGDCTINHQWRIEHNIWSDKIFFIFKLTCLGERISGLKGFSTLEEAQEVIDRLNSVK